MASRKGFKPPVKKQASSVKPAQVKKDGAQPLSDSQYEKIFDAVLDFQGNRSPVQAESLKIRATEPGECASTGNSQSSQAARENRDKVQSETQVSASIQSAVCKTVVQKPTDSNSSSIGVQPKFKRPQTLREALKVQESSSQFSSSLSQLGTSSSLVFATDAVLSQAPKHFSQRQRLQWLQDRRGVGLYIQCDNCKKWRWSDIDDPVDVPEKWICRQNPDTSYNACNIPEKPISVYIEEDLIHNDYTAGSIVWAKLDGYPWWPAMVDDCPDTEQYYWVDGYSDIPTHYHVVFFDYESNDPGRTWVALRDLISFKHQPALDSKFMLKPGHRSRISCAKMQAEEALTLRVRERLQRWSFLARWKGEIVTPPASDSEQLQELVSGKGSGKKRKRRSQKERSQREMDGSSDEEVEQREGMKKGKKGRKVKDNSYKSKNKKNKAAKGKVAKALNKNGKKALEKQQMEAAEDEQTNVSEDKQTEALKNEQMEATQDEFEASEKQRMEVTDDEAKSSEDKLTEASDETKVSKQEQMEDSEDEVAEPTQDKQSVASEDEQMKDSEEQQMKDSEAEASETQQTEALEDEAVESLQDKQSEASEDEQTEASKDEAAESLQDKQSEPSEDKQPKSTRAKQFKSLKNKPLHRTKTALLHAKSTKHLRKAEKPLASHKHKSTLKETATINTDKRKSTAKLISKQTTANSEKETNISTNSTKETNNKSIKKQPKTSTKHSRMSNSTINKPPTKDTASNEVDSSQTGTELKLLSDLEHCTASSNTQSVQGITQQVAETDGEESQAAEQVEPEQLSTQASEETTAAQLSTQASADSEDADEDDASMQSEPEHTYSQDSSMESFELEESTAEVAEDQQLQQYMTQTLGQPVSIFDSSVQSISDGEDEQLKRLQEHIRRSQLSESTPAYSQLTARDVNVPEENTATTVEETPKKGSKRHLGMARSVGLKRKKTAAAAAETDKENSEEWEQKKIGKKLNMDDFVLKRTKSKEGDGQGGKMARIEEETGKGKGGKSDSSGRSDSKLAKDTKLAKGDSKPARSDSKDSKLAKSDSKDAKDDSKLAKDTKGESKLAKSDTKDAKSDNKPAKDTKSAKSDNKPAKSDTKSAKTNSKPAKNTKLAKSDTKVTKSDSKPAKSDSKLAKNNTKVATTDATASSDSKIAKSDSKVAKSDNKLAKDTKHTKTDTKVAKSDSKLAKDTKLAKSDTKPSAIDTTKPSTSGLNIPPKKRSKYAKLFQPPVLKSSTSDSANSEPQSHPLPLDITSSQSFISSSVAVVPNSEDRLLDILQRLSQESLPFDQ